MPFDGYGRDKRDSPREKTKPDANTQTTSADVKPDVDASVVPK